MNLDSQLKHVDELKRQIDAFGEFPVEIRKQINYQFRWDWNYYSNAMEGNTLTKEETRSVMVGNLTVGGKPIKDVFEMHGHDKVVLEILALGKGNVRLSEKRIKEIHSAIMHEENPAQQQLIGQWKVSPNHVINYKGEKFDFSEPNEVPERMHELLNRVNAGLDAINRQEKSAPNPVELALRFHIDYLTIHPFYDGNGRTARLLTNLLLIGLGYPPIIIRKEDKAAYYRYLADVQGYGGSPDLLLGFMAELLIRSQQMVLDALHQGKGGN